jgi:hypothetical protein
MVKAEISDILESLAESIIFGVVSLDTLKSLNLKLKEGKTLGDVPAAEHLKAGQQPGNFEIMVAHVARNLKEVVELDPGLPEKTREINQNYGEYGLEKN